MIVMRADLPGNSSDPASLLIGILDVRALIEGQESGPCVNAGSGMDGMIITHFA